MLRKSMFKNWYEVCRSNQWLIHIAETVTSTKILIVNCYFNSEQQQSSFNNLQFQINDAAASFNPDTTIIMGDFNARIDLHESDHLFGVLTIKLPSNIRHNNKPLANEKSLILKWHPYRKQAYMEEVDNRIRNSDVNSD
ncbi:unnamed protein product, partial [Allacma fusca]